MLLKNQRLMMRYYLPFLLCFFVCVSMQAQNVKPPVAPAFKPDTFNIISYGAKADGLTLNTEAFMMLSLPAIKTAVAL